MRVVKEGRIVEAKSIDTGPIVYRADARFTGYKKDLRKNVRVYLGLLLVGEIVLLLAWANYDFDRSGLVGILFLPMFMLPLVITSLWHLSTLDRGVAIHENGVDMIKVILIRASRTFVPWDEIEEVKRIGDSFGFILRHSGDYLGCNHKMVDEYTEHAIRSMKERAEETDEPPDLHVYPWYGKREE